jgi:hypothetical protein
MREDTIPRIVFAIAVSIAIAFFSYFLITHYAVDVESQFSRENNLLNFYDENHEGDIFILGSSLVLEGIDAKKVEDILQQKHLNHPAYNLGMAADSPLDRVCEIDNIIAAGPEIVVFGVSYAALDNKTEIFEDRMLLCYQRKSVNDREKFIQEYEYLFSEGQLRLTTQTSFEQFFYQRKYIPSYLTSLSERLINGALLTGTPSAEENAPIRMEYLRETNFKNPWILTTNLTEAQKIKFMGDRKNQSWISEDLNPQKRALLHIINKLQQNDIRVIIINMPINPLQSASINEKSRSNLSNFLNSTGVQWYDYEQEYGSDYFIDLLHMNAAGRNDFSPKVAELLADNLMTGA